jgi:outer membrane cobalamin receptor
LQSRLQARRTHRAADISSPANGQLEEIIVTAQRRAESINDVGMSIQAIDAATLDAMRVTSVRDLTTLVPSFTVSQSYQGVPTYTLRGIRLQHDQPVGNSTVGTLRR